MKKYINWGVIGLGNAARAFSSGFENSINSKLLAVASKNDEKRFYFKKKFNLQDKYLYKSYEELISNKEIDIVYIALPHTMHKEWILKSANLKKNVLVEKPATLSINDLKEIIEVVKSNNVFFSEGLAYRYHPFYLQLLSIIKKINPKKIDSIKASFGNDAIGGKKIFGLRLKKPSRNKRLFNPELGGGAIWDSGCYPVSFVRQIICAVNKTNSYFRPLIINAKKKYGSTGVDEYSSLKLQFNETIVEINTSINETLDNTIEIYLSNGKIIIYNPWFPSNDTYIEVLIENKSQIIKCLDNVSAYKKEIEIISDLLLKGKKEQKYPFITLEDIILNIEILEKWEKF